MYDAILFDAGSTLLEFRRDDRFSAWAEIIGAEPAAVGAAWRSAHGAARELNGYATPAEYAAFRAEVCSAALDALSFTGDREAAVEAMSEAWILVGWAPFADVHPVLTSLRDDGYRLGVISNWTVTLETTLAHVRLDSYLDVVACSAVVGAMKPDTRIFRHALDALGVAPERSLYVGDNYEVDVLGARAAGMDAVLLARDTSEAPADDATATVRTLHELRSLLAPMAE